MVKYDTIVIGEDESSPSCDLSDGSVPMWLVRCNGEPYTAQPTLLRAKVYASGFSRRVEIIEGIFIPKKITK